MSTASVADERRPQPGGALPRFAGDRAGAIAHRRARVARSSHGRYRFRSSAPAKFGRLQRQLTVLRRIGWMAERQQQCLVADKSPLTGSTPGRRRVEAAERPTASCASACASGPSSDTWICARALTVIGDLIGAAAAHGGGHQHQAGDHRRGRQADHQPDHRLADARVVSVTRRPEEVGRSTSLLRLAVDRFDHERTDWSCRRVSSARKASAARQHFFGGGIHDAFAAGQLDADAGGKQ